MKTITVTLTTHQFEELAETWAADVSKDGGGLPEGDKKAALDLWLTLQAIAHKHNLWCDTLDELPSWAGAIVQKALQQPRPATLEQLLVTKYGARGASIVTAYAAGMGKKKPKPKPKPAPKPKAVVDDPGGRLPGEKVAPVAAR